MKFTPPSAAVPSRPPITIGLVLPPLAALGLGLAVADEADPELVVADADEPVVGALANFLDGR